MKKYILITTFSFIFVLVLFLFYSFISRGNTWFVNVDLNVANSYKNSAEIYGPLDHPARDEVEAAAKEVKDFFKNNFNGCILLNLSYDEEFTYDIEYSEWYDDAIVFVSDYYVLFGGDGAWVSGELYSDWRWTVRYNHNYNKWEVVNYGYG